MLNAAVSPNFAGGCDYDSMNMTEPILDKTAPEGSPASEAAAVAPARISRRGENFVRLVFKLRRAGSLLLAATITGTLIERHTSHAVLGMFYVYCLAWPYFALAMSQRANDLPRQERCNLLVDSFAAGFMVPLMHFAPVPGVTLILSTAINSVAVGGLKRCAFAMLSSVGGVAVGCLFAGTVVDLSTTMLSTLACLPALMIYPLMLGHTTYTTMIKLGQQSRHLKDVSLVDGLTRLYNRRALYEKAKIMIEQATSDASEFSLLFIDLDQFQLINESVGHDGGDLALQRLADRLSASIPADAFVARYGGDEFVIVTTAAESVAVSLGYRLLTALNQPMKISGKSITVDASAGVCRFPRDGADADSLMKHAGLAVYAAQRSGTNQLVSYTPELEAARLDKRDLSRSLRLAMNHGDLKLHYQPQWDMSTMRIVGVEALLRWTDPAMGVISPADFIPDAEASGLIIRLGEWVLFHACYQAMKWQGQGYPPISIAVNLSPVQLQQPDVVQLVKRVLRVTGLSPELLELEITEGTLVSDVEGSTRKLDELRAIGVRVAIDDFGTGHSSLSYLKYFTVDRIKIDRSFVKDLCQDRTSEAIAVSLIALSKSLHVEILAEGVETLEQVHFLVDHGCPFAQGYYRSPAVDHARLADMLAAEMAVIGCESSPRIELETFSSIPYRPLPQGA